jgi:hypothetical protein
MTRIAPVMLKLDSNVRSPGKTTRCQSPLYKLRDVLVGAEAPDGSSGQKTRHHICLLSSYDIGRRMVFCAGMARSSEADGLTKIVRKRHESDAIE